MPSRDGNPGCDSSRRHRATARARTSGRSHAKDRGRDMVPMVRCGRGRSDAQAVVYSRESRGSTMSKRPANKKKHVCTYFRKVGYRLEFQSFTDTDGDTHMSKVEQVLMQCRDCEKT